MYMDIFIYMPLLSVFCFFYSDCLKLHIFNGVIPDGKTHLLVWAPYIQTQQDSGDDDNVMIAVSHDSRVI